ncbi:MAG: histone deacetylase family protein [Desulfurococcales archaeon]|nr:histone deacetylase family protein [Desulfurococcales archaeon]
MAVLLYHEDFKLHDPSPYEHPENPRRLNLMLSGLRDYGILERFTIPELPLGDVEDYRLVHSEEYLRRVASRGVNGVEWLDPDTYISPGTHKALKRLAGAARLAVDSLVDGEDLLLLLPRPPGHHAGRNGAAMGAPTLGFCILNTSALIARKLSSHGRVTILDFDLHHGNGTQEIVYDDPGIQHVDIHQDPRTIYPGTGYPWQTGGPGAEGTKANIILPPGSRDDVFLEAARLAVDLIRGFDPDYIVVDAGFDGYRGDNYMSSVSLASPSYHELGAMLRRLGRPIVVVVEGGYGSGLLEGLPAFTAGLLGLGDPVGRDAGRSTRDVRERFEASAKELLEGLGLRR